MSLLINYMKTLRFLLKRNDLGSFVKEHDRLFSLAKQTHNHAVVASHYYDLMAEVIEIAYGSSWVFYPPDHVGQSREETISNLHRRINSVLCLLPGKTALDMGCGLGGAARDIARLSQGKVLGLTLSQAEVERANALNHEQNLDHLCEVRQGDYTQNLPFPNDFLGSAYSIYSLKYISKNLLPKVFGQVHRVMEPNARYVVYDAVLTSKYDVNSPQHRALVERIEFVTGMPPLHTSEDLIDAARSVGLSLLSETEISKDLGWSYFFTENKLLAGALRSRAVKNAILGLETVRLFPKGFSDFYNTFIAGTVNALVDADRLGIVSFSRLFVFRKTDS
ncbi:Glycine/sarcosine/dimethylglycine N-methyltransferase [Legionella gratiana]|uniref:Glycine/sarcosine/dimethylglycine N-methyltransferase n=1 Tax=Legionella gratiana TaxID=45066 RepID=A0A378JHG2_9GAMM|nr:class I SAM-dependent methyltransferase [Legionella gratiana]KTD12038.1 Glycine/sarcosine/dimethylglycine N-methyltransferase [Legionella gratiana]STX46358.1 Glycine/sarcosine/dimethylglycine N-methyltransferase [Legionella gratiana]